MTGQDSKGNDVLGFTESVIDGCVYVPGATSEATEGTEQVIFDADIYVPAGYAITALDRLVFGGVVYEVQGDPGSWTSPFTGFPGYMKCPLRIVTGATAHAASGNG